MQQDGALLRQPARLDDTATAWIQTGERLVQGSGLRSTGLLHLELAGRLGIAGTAGIARVSSLRGDPD